MPTISTARDIAEAAVEKEIKRKESYADVTELSTNKEMTKLFKFLTAEEDRHVAKFVALRDSFPAAARTEEYDADMQACMDSVVDDRLYSDIDSEVFVRDAIDTKGVFRLTITPEKKAILFFWKFLPYVDKTDTKIVKAMIEEEKGHRAPAHVSRKPR